MSTPNILAPIFQGPPAIQTDFLTTNKKPTFPWNSWFQAVAVRLTRPVSNVPPATSASAGSPGQIAFDANFLYICTATNTWKRIALVAF